ncbi:MAG: hypothetical protein R3F13_13375 [Prosthecobacter sp.]
MKRHHPPSQAVEDEDDAADEREDLHLYARFIPPPGHDLDAHVRLMDLYAEAAAWRIQQHRADIPEQNAEAVPSPPSPSEPELEVMTREALEDRQACLDAQIQMHEAFSKLLPRMLNGDKFAAEAVLRTAHDVTMMLQLMYRGKPELFHDKTRFMRQLPVLASLNPGWEERARKHVERLKLGGALAHSHLKPSAHKTERNLCRAWAHRAIETLEQNRYGPAWWQSIQPFLEAGNRPDLRLRVPPDWVVRAWQLPPLSKETVKQWAALCREMIREQVPGFHVREEFKHELSRIKARAGLREDVDAGKKLPGRLQNALLDKIADAMRSIVA